MANDLLAITSPGSRALKNAKYEKYCRLRASALPRIRAYREVGWKTSDDADAYSNACQLERRPGVRERIAYLSRQAEELIAEKRQRLEETLWAIHEADIGDCFEVYASTKIGKDGKVETDGDGKMKTVRKQRPRLLSDLPPDLRKVIEDVTVDRHGNVIPRLYSKSEANRELRKFHNIGSQTDRPESDASRLSDAELIRQLADQAKQLGVKIDLNYDFGQQPTGSETDGSDGQLVDETAQPVAAGGSGADVLLAEEERRAAEAAREMTISAQPSPQQRHATPAGSRKLRNRP